MKSISVRRRLEVEGLESMESPTRIGLSAGGLDVSALAAGPKPGIDCVTFDDNSNLNDYQALLEGLPVGHHHHGTRRAALHSSDTSTPLRIAPIPPPIRESPPAVDRLATVSATSVRASLDRQSDTLGVAAPNVKTTKLKVKVQKDVTQENATIEYKHVGRSATCGPITFSDSISFRLGMGQADSRTSMLCSQTQKSEWDVKGTFAGGFTTFTNVKGSGDAFTRAQTMGQASSQTTIKIGMFTFQPVTVVLGAAATKDDASIQSDPDFGETIAQDNFTVYQNGSLALFAGAYLDVTCGASATVSDAGLTLLAGSEQIASFGAGFYDAITGQSAAWSAAFDGTTLYTMGIPLGSFQMIDGGVFLPYDSMPGGDLSEDLSGQIDLSIDTSVAVP